MIFVGYYYLGSVYKLAHEWRCALLQAVEDEIQRTCAVSLIEELLEEQQAVIPLVGLSRGRHRRRTIL